MTPNSGGWRGWLSAAWIPGLQCTATRFRLRQGFRLRAARFGGQVGGQVTAHGMPFETPLSRLLRVRTSGARHVCIGDVFDTPKGAV